MRRAGCLAAGFAWLCLTALLSGFSQIRAEDTSTNNVPPPVPQEYVQVTATRVPEETGKLPASIAVITRQDLVRRGAYDLRSALALAAGIDIAPGGDGGPASSVPEFWGLREFDAFLLLIDGIPWGGAFNPALATLDLAGVDRIEVLRGAAPVMYGATSFVGVINVIHREPGSGPRSLRVAGGSYGTGAADLYLPLPAWRKLQSSLSADFDRHVVLHPAKTLEVVAGVDDLYGRGNAHGGDFDYFVNLDGSDSPSAGSLTDAASVRIRDSRNFSGLYAQVEWSVSDEWRFVLGSRLNRTAEWRHVDSFEFSPHARDAGADRRRFSL